MCLGSYITARSSTVALIIKAVTASESVLEEMFLDFFFFNFFFSMLLLVMLFLTTLYRIICNKGN